jgi:hypothetical protein
VKPTSVFFFFPEVREGLSESRGAAQIFDMERFNLKI